MTENLLYEEIARAAAGGGDIERWQGVAHEIAKLKGFWERGKDYTPYGYTVKLALIASEVFEAIQELRRNPLMNESKLGEELADVALRLFDVAAAFGVDLNQEMQKKATANLSRPHKNGRAF